ncbi:hypothetical protein [Hymenobacter latericus]|uniref:hypothetical protein n=1 Tax=Hymenobacter sp. YIM 151858-1 TaxID=2987688 RepID=UPI002227B2E0|nr:hypothetical protein [Hymenobacter sp. YIM 151858-1]UYZ59187.1 hypothetical protein OIS50_19310 [Hymenobacter sp. YIM 151858-1]
MKPLLLLLLLAALSAASAARPANATTTTTDPVPVRAHQLKFKAPMGWAEVCYLVPDTARLVAYRHPQQAALLVAGQWLSPRPQPEPAVRWLLRYAGLVPLGAAQVSVAGPGTTLVSGRGRYRGRTAHYEGMLYQPPNAEPAVVHLYLATTAWAQSESPLRQLLPEWSPQPMPVLP